MTGMFELFGKLSGLSTTYLKEKLIDWICDKRMELANCMAIALNQSKQSFAEWLHCITLKDDFIPDELTIYCLYWFLNRPTLVYTLNFCWSTLATQFKLTKEELYAKSYVKLIYVGHQMYVELKYIHQPQFQLSAPKTPDDSPKNKPKPRKRSRKVMSCSDKPKRKTKDCKQTIPVPPPPQWTTRRSHCKIDYLQLIDGLDEPEASSPKPKKSKPYSPPQQSGPSPTWQAANKCTWNKNTDLESLMENTLDNKKLPDLVINDNNSETFTHLQTGFGIKIIVVFLFCIGLV